MRHHKGTFIFEGIGSCLWSSSQDNEDAEKALSVILAAGKREERISNGWIVGFYGIFKYCGNSVRCIKD